MAPLQDPVLGHLIRSLETPSTSRLHWVALILAASNQVETLVLHPQFAAVPKGQFDRSPIR